MKNSAKSQFYRIASSISLAAAGVCIALLWFEYESSERFTKVETVWRDYSQKEEAVDTALTDVYAQFGYGGFIHAFKNYILRSDENYYQIANAKLQRLSIGIDRVEAVVFDPAELEQVAALRRVVAQYDEQLEIARELHERGLRPEEIDAQVRVDDTQALVALNILTSNQAVRARLTEKRAEQALDKAQVYMAFSPLFMLPVIGLAIVLALIFKRVVHSNDEAQQAHNRIDEMIRLAPDGILCADYNGQITRVNAAAVSLFGFTEDELLAMKVEQLMPKSMRKKHVGKRKGFFASSPQRQMYDGLSVKALRKDGAEVAISINLSYSEQSRDTIAFLRNIDKEEQARSALQEAKEAADDAAASKAHFLANMSHEIRTPLNGIIGLVRLVLEDSKDHKHQNLLSMINESASSLLNIVNDILTMSKLEVGMETVHTSNVSLVTLTNEVTSIMQVPAEEAGLKLRTNIAPDALKNIITDGGKLKQVLMNLVGNAIKFTEEGGVSINVRTQSHSDGRHDLTIDVVDTGVGISEEDTRRLFDRFQQLDNSSSRKYQGSGLGLSISKDILTLLEGSIKVISTEGQGSKFTITLPVDVQEVSAIQDETTSKNPEALGGKHILVAEDNAVNQAFISVLLDRLGHTFKLASNGEETLALLENKGSDGALFDVILMDIQMPVMDGIEATRRIRASGQAWSEIPIVAFTASALREHMDEYIEAGVNGYVAKPIDPEHLTAEIKTVMEGRGTPEHLQDLSARYVENHTALDVTKTG